MWCDNVWKERYIGKHFAENCKKGTREHKDVFKKSIKPVKV